MSIYFSPSSDRNLDKKDRQRNVGKHLLLPADKLFFLFPCLPVTGKEEKYYHTYKLRSLISALKQAGKDCL